MRTFLDAKSMARDLRESLSREGFSLSHAACLEIIARQFGTRDWNTLSAAIRQTQGERRPLRNAEGWHSGGLSDPKVFRMGLDPSSAGVALIECLIDKTVEEPPAYLFGCLMQSISADRYAGTHVRLTAQLEAVEADLATIWMRTNDASGAILAFDNMTERTTGGALSGSTGWVDRTIVLPVHADVGTVHYGFFLKGCGLVRARRFQLDVVDADVPSTAPPPRPRPVICSDALLLPEPANLGFEQTGDA